MRLTVASLLATVTIIPSARAHYNFDKLIVNGVITGQYEYVRHMTNFNSPVVDVESNDMRCGVGTLASAAATKTYTVSAGSTVGFTVVDGINHPGPLMVYMSRAPGNANQYDGSGDWFKIYQLGVKTFATDTTSLTWLATGLKSVTFKLPTKIPNGQYLLRIEHIAIHGAATVGAAQSFLSCAQIQITGGIEASPTPVGRIPGIYHPTDPGLNFNPYYPPVKNYTMPGPDVYAG